MIISLLTVHEFHVENRGRVVSDLGVSLHVHVEDEPRLHIQTLNGRDFLYEEVLHPDRPRAGRVDFHVELGNIPNPMHLHRPLQVRNSLLLASHCKNIYIIIKLIQAIKLIWCKF